MTKRYTGRPGGNEPKARATAKQMDLIGSVREYEELMTAQDRRSEELSAECAAWLRSDYGIDLEDVDAAAQGYHDSPDAFARSFYEDTMTVEDLDQLARLPWSCIDWKRVAVELNHGGEYLYIRHWGLTDSGQFESVDGDADRPVFVFRRHTRTGSDDAILDAKIAGVL